MEECHKEPPWQSGVQKSMSARELIEIFEVLHDDARRSLERFAKHLKEAKRQTSSSDDYSFSWAGGLKKFRDQYTSVELQHQIGRGESSPNRYLDFQ